MHSVKTGILLSGGMDSMCIAYWKKPDLAFVVDYGQRCAEAEINSAKYVAKEIGIELSVIRVDCSSLGSGLLSGNDMLDMSPSEEWWPYRNQLLVTLACMKGISMGLGKLYVGSIATDSMHKDGTLDFYDKLSTVMEYQEGNIKIEMPAYNMNALDLIRISEIPYYMLLHSHSCHVSNTPCLSCPGCKKNIYIRQQLGIY